ncbi:MAG: Lrp/AsnC ligand binding domain-containing protein [Promethearchaeota archaeon]
MSNQRSIGAWVLILASSNLLWGFIPWPAARLFDNYSSFLIVFTRFIMMAIILFLVIIIRFIIVAFIPLSEEKKNHLQLRELWYYLTARNTEFYHFPQWAYLLIIAIFGLNFMTVSFFFALKTVGAIVTAIGIIISLIGVTAINWGMGKEEMTKFKALYLTTLIVAAFILGFAGNSSNRASGSGGIDGLTIGILLFYGMTLIFFVITGGKDKKDEHEFNLLRTHPSYELIRTLFKLAILALFAALTMIPIMFLMTKMNFIEGIVPEAQTFFSQLPQWYKIVLTPNGIILILVCTIAPYLIYYSCAMFWPPHTSFDLWVSVLQLIEPIVNIILGVTVLNEEFPIPWLLIIIFLIIIAIITRYLSETETQIFMMILLQVKPNLVDQAMQKLYMQKQVREVLDLIGEFDLMLDLHFNSSKRLNRFMQNQIIPLPGLIKYEILMITKTILDRSLPEKLHGNSLQERLDHRSRTISYQNRCLGEETSQLKDNKLKNISNNQIILEDINNKRKELRKD